MNQETIIGVLERDGHGAHRAAVEALIRPTARLVATALASAEDEDAMDSALAALPIGASRFGGVPDLPPGAAWPERDGVPMEFVAQIRLADAAAVGLPGLPATGSLVFFYNSQWITTDQRQPGPVCAVIFHDGPDDALVRATPPRVEFQSEFIEEPQMAPRLHGLASLAFELRSAIPGGVSPFTKPLESFWQDFHANNHQELAPGDTANLLLGYVDAQDYVDAHANGTEDQLLLQVDSDDAAEFQWGDCDRLYFLLTKAELAARDFSNVRLYSILG